MKGIELINASAGSGKTYRLTELVVEKLRGEVAPEGLMATTFTNKAAAELRERIRLQLLKHGKSSEAQRIYDGFVGTVNSVCARLLTEYALDAGLSPALDVMPEDDSERLFQIAIAGVIESHADTMEPAARRLSRTGGGTKYQALGDWRADVRTVVELARANQLGSEDLRECARTSWDSLNDLLGPVGIEDTGGQLDAAVQTAITLLQQIDEPKGKTTESLKKLKDFKRKRRNSDVPWSEWVRLAKADTNKDGEGRLDEVNRLAGDVCKHPKFQEDVRRVILGVFECAGEALQAYDAFKRKQGLMDFVDQETMVLALARDNAAFRASMKDRLQQMMVDEFQDTSPIQLALFLKLNELAGQSVWVGDPKQSIYGFRGTDPQLMEEATKEFEVTQILDESWRSREALVDFSNAVFSKVFHETDVKNVFLKIPDAREDAARGGWIESWNLPAKNKDAEALGLASGVKDLLSRRKYIKPGDVAILCRTNNQREAVAQSLEVLGIRASAGQGSLMETRECRLALAALRYMHDRRDTVALAEIVHLSSGHADHGQWLAALMQKKADATTEWMNDPLIAGLTEARDGLKHRTPLEALELAIDQADVMHTLKSWPNVTMRVSNLDALRGACCEYVDQCRARRSAATVAGFINYTREAELTQAQGSGEQTVQVHTYHGAKGLEWPIVVLAGLDTIFEDGAFGINVVPASEFNLDDPLANRSIRFWPRPFGAQKILPELDTRLAERAEEIEAQARGKEEARRLLYVGITRARDGVVFAMRKHVTKTATSLKTRWLDQLTDEAGKPVLRWPLESGEHVLKVGDSSIAVTVREFSAEGIDEEIEMFEPDNYLAPTTQDVPEYPPARLAPSGLIGDEDYADVEVQSLADLGERIEIKGQPDMASLGNAMHGFLGVDKSGVAEVRQLDMATELLHRWDVEKSISPADMIVAGERLEGFIEKNYPEAKVRREWPITLINGKGQLLQGWIDMLLELPEGYVVIDHKSYPGADALEEAKKYVPQLAVYKEAIEKATGKNVVATLIHMPVLGQMFDVSLPDLDRQLGAAPVLSDEPTIKS